MRGAQSKESCGGGQKKEAAGSYRSRGPEDVPVERELGGEKKEAAGSYRSRRPEGAPVERELRRRTEEGSSRKL